MEKKNLIAKLPSQSKVNASKRPKFSHSSVGRTIVEDTYPQLHQVIVDLATAAAGTDCTTQTDVLNACKTSGDLRASLTKKGYILS